MRRIHLYLLLSIVAFATGCPQYRPSQVDLNNPKSFVNKLNVYFKAKQVEYITAIGSAPDGSEKAKRIRNQFLEDVLPFIDETYMNFITDIQVGRDRANFVADLIELGTSAAVGITNGERPLQILGIGLTAFRGGRRSADLNFYKEQTTPILISKMDGNRASVRATILTREKEGVDTYPLGAAISDIVEYYNAGTLVRAFTELSKDTAVQTQQSEKRVLELKNINPADVVKITPGAAKAGAAFGKHRRAFDKALKGTDPEAKKDATEKLRLIYLDIAKGEKSEAFKPILEKIKKDNPSMKADMEKLEGTEADSKSVEGGRTLDIISAIFTGIDLEKQGDLISTLNDIIENRL